MLTNCQTTNKRINLEEKIDRLEDKYNYLLEEMIEIKKKEQNKLLQEIIAKREKEK